VRLEHARGALVTGGELRFHDGRHIGTLLSGTTLPAGTPATPAYYDYHPRTVAASLFLREEFELAPAWQASADLAWRHAGYAMRGDRFDGIRFDQRYDFLSPRVGLHWRPTGAWQAFASWSEASREPAFRDLYDAEGVGSRPLYRVVDIAAGIYRDPLIRPEHVQDLEVGASWRTEHAALALNLYRMDLRDELVYAGQFDTDLGYPILGNAARSVHQGVELEGRLLRALPHEARLELDGNASLGDHHFVEYRERYGPTPTDEVSYDGQPLGLVPATLANAGARLSWGGASLRLEAQHAGRVYADNTGRESASFPARTVWNGALTVSGRVLGNLASATLRGFNLGDARYVTTGYMDYDRTGTLVPHGMPAATRSWLAEVRLDW
jgi:iron complex outermembrane receptor protein